ncbi:MAG: twin-arginine translocase TatA/TatE family subunit [Chloroflexia bacterium]
MFGIGLPEMLMIGMVALVVLGPDRLPEAARNLGKAIADIRRTTEPARSAWTEMTTEINTAITATTATMATGNPWTVHPILEKMTLEEREIYMKGGEMPERVAQELDQIAQEPPPGQQLDTLEVVADLDYPMPHAEVPYHASPAYSVEPEPISYPPPETINQT